jgi:hypothetical protein
MIIQNYINHFTSDDKERETMYENALKYVKEDTVDEIKSENDSVLEKLLALRTKINNNTCDAWESSLQDTRVVTVLEDFELSTEDEESNVLKYNGWSQDLDEVINFICTKYDVKW